MAFKQEVNVPLIITVGIVSGVVLIVSIIGTQAWYDSEEAAEIEAKAVQYPNQELIDLKHAQADKLDGYRWVDAKNKVVTMPIADAMQAVVQLQGKLPTTKPAVSDAR